jgi:hypothetical protein
VPSVNSVVVLFVNVTLLLTPSTSRVESSPNTLPVTSPSTVPTTVPTVLVAVIFNAFT